MQCRIKLKDKLSHVVMAKLKKYANIIVGNNNSTECILYNEDKIFVDSFRESKMKCCLKMEN